MGEQQREAKILRTSVIGVVVNILLGAIKALMGVLAGSLALISDALNNLSDAASSVITIVGTKLANRRPDREHPFGFGRIEYLTSLIIGIIVTITGVQAFIESVKGILDPEPVEYSYVILSIIIITIFAKILLGNFTIRMGEQVDSGALKASGVDAKNDALVSIVTLASAIIYLGFGVSIDAYAGALISLFVIKAGYDILKETLQTILGEQAEPDVSREIYTLVNTLPHVITSHDLVVNDYGPNMKIGSIHIEVDANLRFKDMYGPIQKMYNKIYNTYNIALVFGFYAIDSESPVFMGVQEIMKAYAEANPHVIGYHGIVVQEDDKEIYCDVTYDFDTDIPAETAEIKRRIEEKYSEYTVYAIPDVVFSEGEYLISGGYSKQ